MSLKSAGGNSSFGNEPDSMFNLYATVVIVVVPFHAIMLNAGIAQSQRFEVSAEEMKQMRCASGWIEANAFLNAPYEDFCSHYVM
jgi:hypothetical protein